MEVNEVCVVGVNLKKLLFVEIRIVNPVLDVYAFVRESNRWVPEFVAGGPDVVDFDVLVFFVSVHREVEVRMGRYLLQGVALEGLDLFSAQLVL